MYIAILIFGVILYFMIWKDSPKRWRWVGLYLLFFIITVPSASILGTPEIVVYPQEHAINMEGQTPGYYKVGWEFTMLSPFETTAIPVAVGRDGSKFDITGYDMSATPFYVPYPFYRTYIFYIWAIIYILIAYFTLREKSPSRAEKKTRETKETKETKESMWSRIQSLKLDIWLAFDDLKDRLPASHETLSYELEKLKETETVSGYDNFIRRYKRSLFKKKALVEEAKKLRKEALDRYIEYYQALYDEKSKNLKIKINGMNRLQNTDSDLLISDKMSLETLNSIVYSLKAMVENPGAKRKLYLNVGFVNKINWTSGINAVYSKFFPCTDDQLKLEDSSLRRAIKKGKNFLIENGFTNGKKCHLFDLLDANEVEQFKKVGYEYFFSNDFNGSFNQKSTYGSGLGIQPVLLEHRLKSIRQTAAIFAYYQDKDLLKTQSKAASKLASSYKEAFACSFDQFFPGERHLFEQVVKHPENEFSIKLQPSVIMQGGLMYWQPSDKKKTTRFLLYTFMKLSVHMSQEKIKSFYIPSKRPDDTSSDIAFSVKSLTMGLLEVPRTMLDPKIEVPENLTESIKSSDKPEEKGTFSKLLKDYAKSKVEGYFEGHLEEHLVNPMLQRFIIPYAAATGAYANTVVDEALMSSMLSGLDITEAFTVAASSGLLAGVGGIELG